MIYQIVLGFIYSSALEWWFHKSPLHKGSGIFRTHVTEHHRLSAKNMTDSDYERVIFGAGESLMIIVGLIIHSPVLFVAPIAYAIFSLYSFLYLVLHRVSHTNSEWAKKWMPWHYIHHTVNAKSNFGIIHPLFDIVMGTYQPLKIKDHAS